MKIRIIFFNALIGLAISISVSQLNAQNPSINWDKTLGGSESDNAGGVVKTSDGSLFTLGATTSSQTGEVSEELQGDVDLWLVKMNENGELIWENSIGGDQSDAGSEILILEDKIYILASSNSSISGDKTAENYGEQDFWLLCLDFDGNILWDRTYGGDQREIGGSLIQLMNSNLLIVGKSESGISGNKTDETNGEADYWLVEIDPNSGDIVQQKSIGSENSDTPFGVAQSSDGDLFLYGVADEGTTGDKTDYGFPNEFDIARDIWIVKTDSDFNVLLDKCFGGEDGEYPLGDIIIYDNHLYFVCGSQSGATGNKSTESFGDRDYWLVKTNLNLEMLWDKSYGGNFTDGPASLLIDEFEKLFIAGTSQSIISGNRTVERYGTGDCWLVITDLDGEEITQEAYGGGDLDTHGGLTSTPEGELIAVNSSNSNASGVKTENSRGGFDYWILSLDASQYLSVEDFEETAFQISTYPNPFSSTIHFDLSEVEEPQQLSIYSSAGKLVHRQKFNNAQRYTWQPANAESGIYFYVLKCENAVVRGKVVKH